MEDAAAALAGLTRRYALVAIVTGRRAEEVTALLDVPHLRYLGLYGLDGDDDDPELLAAAAPLIDAAAATVPAAWVEDKRSSIAVHYRQAPDRERARASLLVALQTIASDLGLELLEGKMVLELVARGRPLKGAAVERLAGEHALRAALYAGDDHADLDAFGALDRLAAGGVFTVKVAVRGAETPPALVEAADVVVDGPAGLVRLLRRLA